MKDLRTELLKMTKSFHSAEGYQKTPVPGVRCIKISATGVRAKQRWGSSFAIVVQGCKEIVLGQEVYRADQGFYTATPIDLPVISRVAAASAESPFYCVIIDLNPIILSEVAEQFEASLAPDFSSMPHSQGLFVGKATDEMLEALVRLVRLFMKPKDAAVLGGLIVKELFYHLLQSSNGASIYQFVRSGSQTQKVSQAIHILRSDLSGQVDVVSLAKAANMSRSAFFKSFKEITSVSPIQYQKRLRLLEARRLMTDEGETAEGAAFRVGYKSASQFSREYSRMFGKSPSRDAQKMRKANQASALATFEKSKSRASPKSGPLKVGGRSVKRPSRTE